MVRKKLTESFTQTDPSTRNWKMRFAAARMTYEDGKLVECERLLHLLLNQAEELTERDFAIKTTQVALGALYQAMRREKDARPRLNQAITELSGAADPASLELYAVALRFRAELFVDRDELSEAEKDLKDSVSILDKLGLDSAVQLSYSLTDFGGLRVLQGQLQEAETLLTSAMEILENVFGNEDANYVRASIMHGIAATSDRSEELTAFEDGICKLQYHLGQQHPNLSRAMRRLIKARVKRGEEKELEGAAEKIAGLGKLLQNRRFLEL